MDLIERGQQFTDLDHLAATAFAGQGQVAVIAGAMGTGRTALLQTFAEQQGRRDVLVLSATCARLERSLACGVLSQLLDTITPAYPLALEIADLLSAATARVGDRDVDATPDAELLRLFHDLCLRLQRLAADRPLLIAIDDVEHADEPSLDFLQQLVRRLQTARILLVLTDSGQSGAGSPFRAELRRQPHLHQIAVSPLSAEGVGELLRWRADHATAGRYGDEFFAATGGNPLLATAMVDDLLESAGGTDHFAAALLSCLQRADPPLLDVARALAVLGDDARRVPFGRLVDGESTALDSARRVMTTAGLLDEDVFRHPVARTAVLADIPSSDRARLHRRAAEVLLETGVSASSVAYQLDAAGQPVPGWAAPVLLEGAELATADGQQAAAISYLELAVRAHTGPQLAATIRARLARIEWETNPAAAARHLGPLAAELRAGFLDQLDGLVLTRQLLWHGRTDEAVEVLAVLRSNAELHPEAAAGLHDLELWLAYAHPQLARRRPVQAGQATQDGAIVTPVVDPWLRATATLTGFLSQGLSAEAVGPAEQTLRDLLVGRHTGWADEAVLAALQVLTRSDQLNTADEWCTRLRSRGGSGPTWRAILAAVQSEIAIGRGDLVSAADHARTALVTVIPKAWGVAIGLPLSNLILANCRLGRFEEATAQLAQPVAEAMLASRYGISYLHARGQYHLATCHHHGALADFLACGDLVRGWGLDAAELVPWRTSAAEAWLRLGNQDQARRLVSDQLTGPGSGVRSRGLALRVLAAASPASRRAQLLAESLDLLERCGDRFEQTRTLVDLIDAHHRLGDHRRTRMVFRRALYMAKVCEAEPLHQELMSISGEFGDASPATGDSDSLADLTDSERRVASLATMGYTNREIAGKLYVTASTVEQHLTRVYRKLKVNDRRALPSDLAWRTGAMPRTSAS